MMTLVLAFMGVARAQSPSSYTFDFENGGFQGWTTIDANHDGYDWMTTSSLLNAWGINLFGGYGHDGSQYFLASQSRDFWHLFFGLEHDNYLVSPRVALGGSISFWATSRADLFLSEEHFGVAVSTTNNYDPNAFTMVDEWTIRNGEPVAQKTGREVRSIYFGTWYEFTVDLSAYSGEGYVAIRHFGNGQWMLAVDDITIDVVDPIIPDDPEPAYVPGLHTLAYYGVGDYERELIDLLYIERPNGAWMEPYHFNLYNDGDYDVDVVLIDFLHNNGYFSMLDDDLYNFTVENNGRPGFDLYLTTNINWTSTDVINSLLAVNTTERSTHLFDIIAVPYQPYCPDVVEKAYNIGTVTTGTTWRRYASEMWNEVNPEAEYNLHDNYTLPFPEIPEGYDAVMKFTADHDIMLNACVSNGANGKVALYREDFAGRPGPMADNNYTMRPFNSNGGGAPVAPTSIDFETGNFSQFSNYTNDATYPWYISANAAYTGSYGMMSGNAGIASSASIFTATVNYTTDGTVSFDYAAWGEGSYIAWDKCVFQIDGEEMLREGATQIWNNFSTEVAAGEHTFSWIYEKDESIDPMGDYFAVDNIVFEGGRIAGNRDIATSFESELGSWTTIDADGDGLEWYTLNWIDAGWEENIAHGGDAWATSASYQGAVLYPDNYLVSPQVTLGGSISFWACAQDASWAAEKFGVAVSTTGNTNPSDFTTLQSWTMSAKGMGGKTPDTRSRSNRAGNWYLYTVDLSDYAGQTGYVAIRHYDCFDQFRLNVDDVTIVEGVAPTPDDPTPDDPTPDDPTPVDPDTPVIPTPASFSAGPVIENLNVLKGTYYLVASSTDPDFEVTINYEELPCPIAAVTNIYPADNAWGISPEDLILRWRLNDYANEWRLVFSSTYWPEDEIDTEHPATYVTEWSSNLQESFNISAALEANGYQLWNNTNYFWRIEQRSNPGTEWECYTQGPVFGFTTTFNVPQHLTATNTRIFEYEETVTLSWDPIVDRNNDRTYRRYRIYMDGERIYDTPDNVVTTSWVIPQNLLTYNMYNEHGYVFEVTAVYDEGESPKSNAVEIWVSGNGFVSGTAYEQDGVTPIGGVTVTIQGFNEFNGLESYTFTTDENGYYEGAIHAGQYPIAVAQKEGYQDAITVHPLPLHIVYQELTDHVDFIMDEIFYAPAHVCAQTVYVPGVEGDTLVQVWWDFNFFTELRENFEDWENTPFAWVNNSANPWVLTTEANEGSFALKSGNAGVTSSTSEISVAVNIPQDGMFSFEYNCQGEGSYTFWDHCDFVMDGNTIFSHGADLAGWQAFSTPITAGTHSFTWSYTKDSSVNPTGDCFTIDNIVFVGHPEDVANSRALHHFNIYRTDCYNDGPYTDENTTFLATVWRPDTSYFDVSWPEAPVGVYKWGVSAVYRGNQADNPNNPRLVEYPNEERESEIVWHTACSPCIDKDMYLNNVSVNVVLNSADSPEGTVVSFLNLMPGEQMNYPQAPITLDATGHYVFPTFRKGTYLVTVSLPGYETIQVEEPIWTNRDLRYVLTEIIYSVKNVYVSRTGWAMWQPITPDDQPAVLDFENGFGDFEFVNDAEYPWTVVQEGPFHTTYCIKSGNAGVANSTSAIEATVDYIEAGQVKFDALCQGEGTATAWDKCIFYIDGEAQFTHGAEVAGWNNYRFNVAQGTHTFRWEYSKDSSVNPDGDCFKVDNINFGIGYTTREERHLEGYKIMCTSIDDEPIFNHDTPADQPFCQLTTVDPWSGADVLIEGERYKVKVCAIYSTGQSAWSEAVIWQYEPCEHWGPVDEVTVGTQSQGNHIEWVFEHGHNQWVGPIDPSDPQGGDASSFSYDCEDGMPEGWTNIDADGDGNVWVSSMTPGIYHNAGVDLTGTGHNQSDAYVISGSYANQTGMPLTPDNYFVSPQVTLGGTFSFWACGQDDTYCHEHFGVAVSTTGNTNAADFTTLQEWTINAKGQGAKTRYTRSDSMRQTSWTQYTVDLSAYAGQTGYVAIRHFNCTDEFILNVDDIEMNVERGGDLSLVSGGAFYNQYAEDGVTLNFLALDNVDLRAYLLYNISKDSRFSLTAETQYGQFVLTPASDMNNFMEAFESFYQDATYNFSMLSKNDIYDNMSEWKSGVASQDYLSITMDLAFTNNRPDNDHCITSLPFCTTDLIEFEAASTDQTAEEENMDDGCIGSSYNPSFYHMRIHTGGPFVIHMEGHDPNNGTNRDIDFCMWGPYTEQEVTSGYACTHLTSDKIMDCCYSSSYTEDCYLGYPESQHQHNTSHYDINYHMPEVGEYYILMITNFSRQDCVINFTKIEGEGETDCEIVTPSDIIGFLITQDGEYLDIVGPDVREYDDLGEFGEHVYCVRPIYPGPAILSDTNYYFSMGCPVCMSTNGEIIDECEAGDPLFAEVNNETDQVHLWWNNDGPVPPIDDYSSFAMSFEGLSGNELPADWTTIDADGDGNDWYTLNWIDAGWDANVAHTGDMWATSASYTSTALYPDNYLVSPQVTLGGTLTFWACAQDASWAAEHFGVAISTSGNTNASDFNTIQEWTMTAKGLGAMTRDTRDGGNRAGTWYQYTVDLSDYAGMTGYVAIRHFNCTDMFRLNIDDIEMNVRSMGTRDGEIVAYNIYRSEDGVEYELIATVPGDVTEYFDAPGAGTFYYQVTAVYADGCESEPAVSGIDPETNYVLVGVDAIGENSDNVNLFPNPTKGNVTIQAKGMNRITVVSVLGQVVFDTELDQDEYILNMAQFNTGMYMVRVYTNEGVTVKRVTVMH